MFARTESRRPCLAISAGARPITYPAHARRCGRAHSACNRPPTSCRHDAANSPSWSASARRRDRPALAFGRASGVAIQPDRTRAAAVAQRRKLRATLPSQLDDHRVCAHVIDQLPRGPIRVDVRRWSVDRCLKGDSDSPIGRTPLSPPDQAIPAAYAARCSRRLRRGAFPCASDPPGARAHWRIAMTIGQCPNSRSPIAEIAVSVPAIGHWCSRARCPRRHGELVRPRSRVWQSMPPLALPRGRLPAHVAMRASAALPSGAATAGHAHSN